MKSLTKDVNNSKIRVCFFSHESKESLMKEQYSIQDISILNELGYTVEIANSFSEIPWGCDLYFSWWASGSILSLIKARLSKKPIIVIAGGNEAMFRYDSISKLPYGYLSTPWHKKLATRLCLRFGTVILVVSNFMIDDVRKLGASAPKVIHNSIKTDAFCLSDLRRTYITTIFNLDENVVELKRGDNFIRSIPYVLGDFPGQKFVVIGKKGNAFQRLQKLTSDLGIERNIEFIGSINNSEVIKWLQLSKAYVQISDTETFGVAIAEAMSCGTPVVVSHRGAIPEIVDNCGFFVDHNNPESVAAGIIEVLKKTDEEITEIGLKSRDRIINNFSYEQRKKSIKEIIEEII
jgi:glycosyltransferase involved in cell wall biosynthesis